MYHKETPYLPSGIYCAGWLLRHTHTHVTRARLSLKAQIDAHKHSTATVCGYVARHPGNQKSDEKIRLYQMPKPSFATGDTISSWRSSSPTSSCHFFDLLHMCVCGEEGGGGGEDEQKPSKRGTVCTSDEASGCRIRHPIAQYFGAAS